MQPTLSSLRLLTWLQKMGIEGIVFVSKLTLPGLEEGIKTTKNCKATLALRLNTSMRGK